MKTIRHLWRTTRVLVEVPYKQGFVSEEAVREQIAMGVSMRLHSFEKAKRGFVGKPKVKNLRKVLAGQTDFGFALDHGYETLEDLENGGPSVD